MSDVRDGWWGWTHRLLYPDAIVNPISTLNSFPFMYQFHLLGVSRSPLMIPNFASSTRINIAGRYRGKAREGDVPDTTMNMQLRRLSALLLGIAHRK